MVLVVHTALLHWTSQMLLCWVCLVSLWVATDGLQLFSGFASPQRDGCRRSIVAAQAVQLSEEELVHSSRVCLSAACKRWGSRRVSLYVVENRTKQRVIWLLKFTWLTPKCADRPSRSRHSLCPPIRLKAVVPKTASESSSTRRDRPRKKKATRLFSITYVKKRLQVVRRRIATAEANPRGQVALLLHGSPGDFKGKSRMPKQSSGKSRMSGGGDSTAVQLRAGPPKPQKSPGWWRMQTVEGRDCASYPPRRL